MSRKSRRPSTVAVVAVVMLGSLAIIQSVRRAESADAATVTLAPVADTSVNGSAPTTTAGSAGQLIVDGSPQMQTFVRFDLSSVTGVVQTAKLRLHVDNVANAGSPAGGSIATTSNASWPEATTSWNNRPTIDLPVVTTLGAVKKNTWVEIDVKGVVQPGVAVSFAASSTNSDGAYYDSRETGATAPQLVVTTAAVSTTTTTTTTVPPTTTTTTTPASGNVLVPVADTYVDETTASTNYGTVNQVIVDASPRREVLLRFDLSALTGPLQSARLRLHGANVSNAGSPAGGDVSTVNDNTWVENTVTYTTRPTAWSTSVASFGAVAQNAWAEVDVTAAVTTGVPLTLGLRSANADGAYYDSREAGANAPQLVVVLGSPPPPVTGVVVAAAGDAACAPGGVVTATTCRQQPVSDLVVADPSIAAFLALGDLQYENGELAGFQTAYGPSYGRFKTITKPAPGNHEYNTAGASGYYAYFGAGAGDPAKGYYSFDLGAVWHVVALNSNCSIVACSAGSAQAQWLATDLATNSRPCVVAYWHHPRFSSGAGHGDDPSTAPFWDILQQHGAELVLNGHAHGYERVASQLPDGTAAASGIREIIAGTGGRSFQGFGAAGPNSVVRLSAFGILKLTLGDGAYSWRFVGEGGNTLDSGSDTCH